MPPQQPATPPPSYDFILNNQQQRSGLSLLNNQDPGKRRLLAVGFVIAVVLLAIIVLAALFSGGSEGSTALKRVLAQQNEIVRIANDAQGQVRDPAARNRIATLLAYTASDYQALTAYAAQNGVSISEQELATFTDTTTDDELQTAQERGNYDSVAESILEAESQEYAGYIQAAANESSNQATLNLLNQLNQNLLVYNQ